MSHLSFFRFSFGSVRKSSMFALNSSFDLRFVTLSVVSFLALLWIWIWCLLTLSHVYVLYARLNFFSSSIRAWVYVSVVCLRKYVVFLSSDAIFFWWVHHHHQWWYNKDCLSTQHYINHHAHEEEEEKNTKTKSTKLQLFQFKSDAAGGKNKTAWGKHWLGNSTNEIDKWKSFISIQLSSDVNRIV